MAQRMEQGEAARDENLAAAHGRADEDLQFIAKTELWMMSLEWLTPQKIVQVWMDSNRRPPGSQDELFNTYVPLVLEEARLNLGCGLSCQELFDAGCQGLWVALSKYNWHRSWKFERYGQRLIQDYVEHLLVEPTRLIGLPPRALRNLQLVDLTIQRRFGEFGRDPTVQEVAASLHATVWQARLYMHACQQPLSLGNTVGNAEDSETDRVIAGQRESSPEEATFNQYYKEQLERNVEKLPERPRKILIYREGLQGEYEHTLEEVGTMFQITRERIRQIEAKAKHKLQEKIGKENGLCEEDIHHCHVHVADRTISQRNWPTSDPLQPTQPLPHVRLRHVKQPALTERRDHWAALRLLSKGDAACRQGDLARAARCYRVAIAVAPMLPVAWESLRWLSTQPDADSTTRRRTHTTESEHGQSLLWNARWGYLDKRFDDSIAVSRFLKSLFPSWPAPRKILVCALDEKHRSEQARAEYDELVRLPGYNIGDFPPLLLYAIVVGDEQSVDAAFHDWLAQYPQSRPDQWESESISSVLNERARVELLAGHQRNGLLCVKGAVMLREKPTQAQLLALYGLSRRLREKPDAAALVNMLRARDIYVPRRLESIGTIRARLASHKRKVTDGPADGG